MGEQHVEVAFGDVRPGEADLVRTPAALQGALTSPGEQASMPTLSGVPGAPRPRNTSRTSGSGFALSAKRRRNGTRSSPGHPATRGRSRRTGPCHRRTAASRARARASRRRRRRSAAGRRRCRAPAGPTTGPRSRSGVRVGVAVRWCAVGCAASICRGLPRWAPRGPRRAARSRPRSRRPPLERLGVPDGRLGIAADLADVLAGGGLQFARRRHLIGATQGLDASAHARTVRHPAMLGW